MRSWIPLALLVACSGKPTRAPVTAPTPAPAPSAALPAAAPAPAPSSPLPPPPSAPGVKVTLADVGLESGSLDRTVDPCVDFYQFACGGWLAQNQIPPDRANWGRGSEVDDRNKVAIKAILEEAAKGIGADAGTKKLGDYYAACMDEAAIEKTGLAGIRPLLDKAQKIKDAKSWLAALVEMHKLGGGVVWSISTYADLADSGTSVLYLDSAGLGLPDRDYYLTPDLKPKVDAYRTHVAKILALAGGAPAASEARAADVLAIEMEIAKLTKTGVEKRDVQGAYNPTDLKGLGKQVKSVDWKAYFKALGIDPGKRVVVMAPKFFAGLDKLRAKFKPAAWSSYFTYHTVNSLAFALPKAFDDEAFELEKVLRGVETRQERSKRCIEATQDGLGELLGQQYAAKYFPGSSRQTANQMVDAIVRAMGEQIGRLDWMSEATKQIAQGKLGRIARMIGYPDKWKTYDFEVRRAEFAGNQIRAAVFETHRQLARAGKPVDRTEWLMNTYTVDAYYDPTANKTALPAGILQPPFFGQDRSVAANLGGIGMVIGHELTHGFDDQGAQFDADGNLKNWWSKDDAAKFAEKGACVADQYSSFEAAPKAFVNGRLTLGENIADLGGVKMAFQAYRALRKDAAKAYVADGFSEDQQFFLAVGQGWCSKMRPAELQRRLIGDVHAPPKFRVYGALRNLPEFGAAFSCAPGTPMHPAKTCSVW